MSIIHRVLLCGRIGTDHSTLFTKWSGVELESGSKDSHTATVRKEDHVIQVTKTPSFDRRSCYVNLPALNYSSQATHIILLDDHINNTSFPIYIILEHLLTYEKKVPILVLINSTDRLLSESYVRSEDSVRFLKDHLELRQTEMMSLSSMLRDAVKRNQVIFHQSMIGSSEDRYVKLRDENPEIKKLVMDATDIIDWVING